MAPSVEIALAGRVSIPKDGWHGKHVLPRCALGGHAACGCAIAADESSPLRADAISGGESAAACEERLRMRLPSAAPKQPADATAMAGSLPTAIPRMRGLAMRWRRTVYVARRCKSADF